MAKLRRLRRRAEWVVRPLPWRGQASPSRPRGEGGAAPPSSAPCLPQGARVPPRAGGREERVSRPPHGGCSASSLRLYSQRGRETSRAALLGDCGGGGGGGQRDHAAALREEMAVWPPLTAPRSPAGGAA